MAERIKNMAGEGNSNTEGVSSNAVLTSPQEGNGVTPAGTEPLSAEDAVKEAQSIVSQVGQATDPKVYIENQPKERGWLSRFKHPKMEVIVKPENFTTDAEPQEDQQGQLEITDQTQTTTAEVATTGNGGNNGAEGNGGDGNGGDNGGLEGPRGPEYIDYEMSPEWGRFLSEEIIRFRTTMSYEERYNDINGPILKQRYEQLQEYVNAICRSRNERDPWDRYIRDDQGHVINVRTIQESPLLLTFDADGVPHLEKSAQVTQQIEQKSFIGPLRPLTELIDQNGNLVTPTPDIPYPEGEMALHYQKAKEKGLLKGADDILKSAFREIQGLPANRASRVLAQALADAEEAAESDFESKITDPQVAELANVWRPYIHQARLKIGLALTNQEQPPYKEGEFRLDEGENNTETYWDVGSYPKYYYITAKTPEQFLIAKESFLRMIRNGSLGKAPDQIYEHVNNFKEVFGQTGNKQVEAGTVSHEFLMEQRLELEAQLYIFGADYSNETYNPEQFQKFMTALALHEGPDRWVRLIRAGDGQVGAFTYMFDKEAIMEIFNNPVGERGELDIIAQHFLQDQVKEIAIEKGMGIALKDYDPDDTDSDQIKISPDADLARQRIFKSNLERIGIHMPDEEFRALYDGFNETVFNEIGDAHTSNFLRFRGEDENKLPVRLRNSINLGKIQVKLRMIRQGIRNGEIKLKPRQTVIDLLSESEKKVYQVAHDQAEANFDIAFQMQGVSGEKVRRGRGFLYVDRNIHVQAYKKVEEKSARIEWILGQLEKCRNDLEKKARLKEFSEEIQTFYNGLTDQEKKKNSQGLYGIDDKILSPEQQRSIRIGWMLSEMKERRRLDSFELDDRNFYEGLTDQEKNNYVDNVPTYLAEKFIQVAETRTKIQYANDSASVRSDAVDRARENAIQQIKQNGFEAKLVFPKVKFDNEGDVDGLDGDETETVNFQEATNPNNIYNRYTTHTYWGYQGENRHMLLTEENFEAAKRIRAGLSRPQDEDMLATMLLITDPTLNRVKKFETDKIGKEITLLQAAVNESTLNHQRINRELFKAFLPKDGNRGKMRAGYNMEDWGGQMRFVMGIKELMASQPARFTRRLGAEIAIAPIYLDAMGSIWGQEGVLGASSTFADQIKRYSHQGVVGQFGMTKFIDQQANGVNLYNALIGTVQEGKHMEGLYMKPTNDNESLHQFIEDIEKIKDNPKYQLPYLIEFRKTLGRLEAVLKIMRVLYSDVRNSGGALDLRKVDVFLENGKFNPDIDNIGTTIAMYTGTSRQAESEFYDEFTDWLISEEPGGGGLIYPEELVWNQFVKLQRVVYKNAQTGAINSSRTFKAWFFEKAGL